MFLQLSFMSQHTYIFLGAKMKENIYIIKSINYQELGF